MGCGVDQTGRHGSDDNSNGARTYLHERLGVLRLLLLLLLFLPLVRGIRLSLRRLRLRPRRRRLLRRARGAVRLVLPRRRRALHNRQCRRGVSSRGRVEQRLHPRLVQLLLLFHLFLRGVRLWRPRGRLPVLDARQQGQRRLEQHQVVAPHLARGQVALPLEARCALDVAQRREELLIDFGFGWVLGC